MINYKPELPAVMPAAPQPGLLALLWRWVGPCPFCTPDQQCEDCDNPI